MATKKPAPRKRPAARTPVTRRPPRGRGPMHRLAAWCARILAHRAARHRTAVRSRKDAAILRVTHAGCGTCHGTGTVYTKDKHGTFTGSKACPAKPATMKVSRVKVAAAARVGVDKRSGLIGWRCPCGAKEKPRYRDAKAATAALRTHERARHGGTTVGGSWYAQLPEGTPATALQFTPAAPKEAPVSKPNTSTTMTDAQWEKQNSPLSPAAADRKGVCWCCGGKGALYTAFGGEQKTVVCNICTGTGKGAAAKAKAAS
jgi:hypothetical protein